MKAYLRSLIGLLIGLALIIGVWPLPIVRAQTPVYNTAFLTDAQLEDYGALSVDLIRAFLTSHNSYFKDAIQDVDGVTFDPSTIIAQAAQQYRINPQVILTTMEKEGSSVTKSTRPTDARLKFLMGCNTPSTARDQLACAAERFRAYQDSLNQRGTTVSGWQVGTAKATQDGVLVTPVSKAVAGQFTYTPYAGAQWGGNQASVGGVYLFYDVWQRFGFGNAASVTPPAVLPPPSTGGKRIGIQAGHWKTNELPDELSKARTETGAAGEAQVNLNVANALAETLRARGYIVDVLPATIPPGYSADAFLAIHCDGSNDTSVRGYKIAPSGYSQQAEASGQLSAAIKDEYAKATGLSWINNITDDMRHYFAFNFLRFQHAISASTPAALIELGYVSNAADKAVLTQQQDKVVAGIANGLVKFLGGSTSPGVTGSTATLLVIDISGSMSEAWQGGVKIESAKNAATDILNMIEQESKLDAAQQQIGVATFSTGADLNLTPTVDYANARTTIGGLSPTERTNIGAGLQVANQALSAVPGGTKKIIILLSDGLTNEGLPGPDILSGPVQEAKAAGTCIYTVGFGDQGNLDEELLRNIATQSGCGEYYYASAAAQLEQIYIKLRHQSLGTVIGEFQGQVAQSQTVPIGSVNVPANQGTLYVTLHWPGSALDLIVTDPAGRQVTPNYPGASMQVYDRLIYLIVQNPPPGAWQAQTFGREVPEGVLTYDSIFSVRQGTGQPAAGVNPLLIAGLLLGLALVAVAAVIMVTRSGANGPVVQVMRGQAAQPFARVGGRGLVIGRDPRSGLVLLDPKASRQHARIMRTPQGYYISDLGSSSGTFVNGQKYKQKGLHPGDVIQLGDTELAFQPQDGLQAVPMTMAAPTGAVMSGTYLQAGSQMIPLPLEGGLIGRDPQSLVVLADNAASRRHAQLTWQGGFCVITDLGSSGTFVNGQRLSGPVTLQSGDTIHIGNTDLIFVTGQ